LDEQEAATGASRRGQQSQNVRADGFFSIQVIVGALQNAGFEMNRVGSSDSNFNIEHANRETGFIFNRSQHWFSLRNIGGYWFDLNSMKPVPVHLSDTHVRMFVEQMKQDGYDVFIVRGRFAPTELEKDRQKLSDVARQCSGDGAGAGFSMSGGGGGGGGGGGDGGDNFKAFEGQGNSMSTNAGSQCDFPDVDPELMAMAESDPELAAAIAASMSEAAPAPAPAKRALTKEEEAAAMRAKRLARFG
jgi:hypothetical protein